MRGFAVAKIVDEVFDVELADRVFRKCGMLHPDCCLDELAK
jgi:hypothetical protein